MQNATRFFIELEGTAAGVVVAENGRYRFFASNKTCSALNHRIFRNPAHAEDACRRLVIGLAPYDRPEMTGEPIPESILAPWPSMVGG